MGGTFNPIHLGQMIVGEICIDTYNLDEVLLVPRGEAFIDEDLLDAKTRITMTGIAIEDNSHFALSTLEVDRGNSYTYQTLETLKGKNPDTTYYYIVGADYFVKMGDWKYPEKVFSEVEIIVAPRLDFTKEEVEAKAAEYQNKYGAKINYLPINPVDLSSKKIRERIKSNKSIRYMVHYKVIEYINKNNIYSDQDN